ncbi:MAG: hypothetical protein IKU00_08200 [Bacteroidales bacterium]|nr:hypothetical protein [Bacteroidales bacterium]
MRQIVVIIACLLLGLTVMAQSPQPYLVSDFNEDELETVLDLCRQGGFKELLHRCPFSSYGHYEWNPSFAKKGNRSVARMVQKAAEAGVRLGILVNEDAVSLNDAFFAPRFYKQLRKTGPVQLFSDITAEQRDLVIYHSEELDQPSTLNLLLIGKEMVSYGTMEPAGDMLFLHGCSRGLYGTKAEAHEKREEAYKLWDAPERYCAPDGVLLDSVRKCLAERIVASGSPFSMPSGGYGQAMLNTSQRVQLVDRWTKEQALLDDGEPMMLGWFPILVSDKRQSSTTLEDLEWLLSKAVAFDAGYGLVIDRIALKRHGQLDKMMALVKAWNRVCDENLLTPTQKEELGDPYTDWHLEPESDESYLLFPVRLSRGYRCIIAKAGPIEDTWLWKSEETNEAALRVEIKGQGEIRQPMLITAMDTLRFPCVVKAGQYLLCDFDGIARVTDADYRTLKEFAMDTALILPEGESTVIFKCEVKGDKKLPEVSVRYLVREQPIRIKQR